MDNHDNPTDIARVHCLVTAGATIEPIDEVRRLTNHSTGRLGCLLADSLQESGHQVTLLLSSSAQFHPQKRGIKVSPFTTSNELGELLQQHVDRPPQAIFHVAAVSDFTVSNRTTGKIKSGNALTLELTPAPKLIQEFRSWYPESHLIGWKYEVEGNAETALEAGRRQLADCQTNACVVNGPAYGTGFGVVQPEEEVIPCDDEAILFQTMEQIITSPQ